MFPLKVATILTLAVLALPTHAQARSRFSPGGILGLATAPLRMLTGGFHARTLRSHRAHRAYAFARRPPLHTAATASPAAAAALWPAHRPRNQAIEPARQAPEPTSATQASLPKLATQAATPQPAKQAVAPSFNAYESLLGYALLPDDYVARLWTVDYRDALNVVLGPAAASAAAPQASKPMLDATGSIGPAGLCGHDRAQLANKPIEHVAQSLELTQAQRQALDGLGAALTEAIERAASVCRDAVPQTLSERLRAIMDGLWALQDATLMLRGPLRNFYESLTDEQKARLAGARIPAGDVEQLCLERSSRMSATLIGGLERAVRLPQEQGAGVDALREFLADTSKYLGRSCPHGMPAGAIERLDAAADRIDAMLYAALTIAPALNEFYSRLSDEQKAQFNSLQSQGADSFNR